uniref:Uncharacterized protein n=1 Tax=Arundo donax TaxID=35708 RepID=A0A0A8ZXA3_ARUDO
MYSSTGSKNSTRCSSFFPILPNCSSRSPIQWMMS